MEPLSGCRQPIPLQQLSGLIAPKKKGRKGGEINKLSTESVIYRRCVVKKKKKKAKQIFVMRPLLPPSLPASCLSAMLCFVIFKGWIMGHIVLTCDFHDKKKYIYI